ncbi:hypothetical protein [Janibacter melonis]|uniref:hypothetical protein n=1 Tax=Janibacter melonis TaxID=262209 RepID=UPI002094BB4C|nr:hypothetical protein [Janibacter melonis]
MSDRHLIELTVNGEEHELLVEARETLADVIRHRVAPPARTSRASTASAARARSSPTASRPARASSSASWPTAARSAPSSRSRRRAG